MAYLHKLKKKILQNNQSEIRVTPESIEGFAEISSKINIFLPIPDNIIKNYPLESWIIFLGHNGVYQLPTEGLISFLGHLIKGKKAIEICCGMGLVANALGIPATDRMLSQGTGNENADIMLKKDEQIYARYPYQFLDNVENLTSYQAVIKYRPDIVIGCWVTPKAKGRKLGSAYGTDEEKLLQQVKTYIHCGSSVNPIHSHKEIRKYRHWTIEADWLLDRASLRGQSQLKIWTEKEPDWDSFPGQLEFDIL